MTSTWQTSPRSPWNGLPCGRAESLPPCLLLHPPGLTLPEGGGRREKERRREGQRGGRGGKREGERGRRAKREVEEEGGREERGGGMSTVLHWSCYLLRCKLKDSRTGHGNNVSNQSVSWWVPQCTYPRSETFIDQQVGGSGAKWENSLCTWTCVSSPSSLKTGMK